MKILRSKDWKLVGLLASSALLGGGPAFLFQHEAYGDVLALNEAKYVDVESNTVFFLDAQAEEMISVSRSAQTSESLALAQGLRDNLQVVSI